MERATRFAICIGQGVRALNKQYGHLLNELAELSSHWLYDVVIDEM